MILLWGLASDRPLAAVRTCLSRAGRAVTFFDQSSVLDSEIELCVEGNSTGVSADYEVNGTLRVGNQIIALNDLTAAYLRPHDSRRLPEIAHAGRGSAAWDHALGVADALLSWADLTTSRVVNRPAAMAANNSKPYQAALIQSFGFATPETLITTDPDAARAFWRQCGDVIYKSVSSVRSIVSRLAPQDGERLNLVSWCPTQFQRYVPGREYRVHVVGDSVFASEVISDASDYRYASRLGSSAMVRAAEIATDVVERCQILVRGMGLLVAGVDLRCTPEGTWYCFEVNPSPGFTYFEREAGQPIAETIARLLSTAE